MGWSSGSNIGIAVVTAVKKHVKDSKARESIYKDFLKAMEDQDWDTQAMGIDPIFDKLVGSDEDC